jgi:hypothetical protein
MGGFGDGADLKGFGELLELIGHIKSKRDLPV